MPREMPLECEVRTYPSLESHYLLEFQISGQNFGWTSSWIIWIPRNFMRLIFAISVAIYPKMPRSPT